MKESQPYNKPIGDEPPDAVTSPTSLVDAAVALGLNLGIEFPDAPISAPPGSPSNTTSGVGAP